MLWPTQDLLDIQQFQNLQASSLHLLDQQM